MSLFIEENKVNLTKGWRFGDSGVYESYFETPGEAYRACVKEHGRCTGRMYIDTIDGKAKPIGWVFLKRAKYDDCDETFLQETWVTLHEKMPTRTVENHYHELE